MSRIFDSTQTLSVLALVLFLPQGPVFAAEAGGDRYESSHALPVGQVLEPDLVKGPYYQVEDPVWHDGYTNVYQVTSPFGSFLVRGMPCSPGCVANSRPLPTCGNARLPG